MKKTVAASILFALISTIALFPSVSSATELPHAANQNVYSCRIPPLASTSPAGRDEISACAATPVDRISELSISTREQVALISRKVPQRIAIETPRKDEAGFSMTLPIRKGSSIRIDGSALVSDDQGGYSVSTELGDGFTRSSFTIASKKAPSRYRITYDFAKGVQMRFSTDSGGKRDGSIECFKKNGEIVAAINTPWAFDRFGKPIKTHYELSGNNVVQVIEHKQRDDIAYPITADPLTSFGTWFESQRWKKVKSLKSSAWKGSKTGWSLELVPSAALKVATVALPLASFGSSPGSRIVGSAIVNTAWSKVYKKCHKNKHWRNTESLKNQFYCHFYLLAAKRITQNSWFMHIEPARPNVSLARNIAASCNP